MIIKPGDCVLVEYFVIFMHTFVYGIEILIKYLFNLDIRGNPYVYAYAYAYVYVHVPNVYVYVYVYAYAYVYVYVCVYVYVHVYVYVYVYVYVWYRQCQMRKPTDQGAGLSSSRFLAWSSIARPVCQRTFGLLAIWCLGLPRFESCIQQRKTACFLSIRKSLVCARASKLTTNNIYARWSKGRDIEFKFLAWPSIAQLMCQRAFSLLQIRFQRPGVRILHSAEEDNLSPFHSISLPFFPVHQN